MNMEKEVQILNINDVLPNRFQPRITFDEKAIMELSESIKEHGVIQPIVVRRIADKYEIIAGERRYKASILAGKTTIPAIVTDLDDKDSAEIALIENVQRQDLTPIEEAVSYKKILDMGYLNQSELAAKLGKTQSTVANKLRLLNLTDEVQEALLKEKISERHARSLLKLNSSDQNMMLNRIITERMTVRKTDEEIAKLLNGEGTQDVKESESMNNEINNFNMPSVSIIEPEAAPVVKDPVEAQIPAQQVAMPQVMQQEEPIEIPKVEPINPGFMDVNRIEEQARDINFMPDLLSETIKSENSNQINTVSNTLENVNGIVSPVNNIVAETPTFMPDVTNQAPALNNIPVSQVTEEPQSQGGRFFSSPLFSPAPQESTIEPVQQVSEPVNNIFGTNINENVEQTVPQQPIMSTPTEQPLYQQNASMNQVPFMQVQPEINTNQSVVEMGGMGYIPEEPVLQPLMTTAVDQKKHDMKEAIALIRNCSKEIEKLGFKIEVEEIDFENYYQANFRIDKD